MDKRRCLRRSAAHPARANRAQPTDESQTDDRWPVCRRALRGCPASTAASWVAYEPGQADRSGLRSLCARRLAVDGVRESFGHGGALPMSTSSTRNPGDRLVNLLGEGVLRRPKRSASRAAIRRQVLVTAHWRSPRGPQATRAAVNSDSRDAAISNRAELDPQVVGAVREHADLASRSAISSVTRSW